MAKAKIVTCEDCKADVPATDIARISMIKYRYALCDDCYQLRRQEGR